MKKLYLALFVSLLISLFYDKEIVSIITNNRLSILDGFMVWVTNPLTIVTIFFLITTLFLWEERKRGWILPLWASAALSAAIAMVMKIIISRPRPFEIITIPLVKGAGYVFSAWNTSFPSMHAAITLSAVPILDKEFPKLKWFWIILASLIILSRVYVGMHYLSDILAGCLLGLLIGQSIIHLERKYGLFKIWIKKKR